MDLALGGAGIDAELDYDVELAGDASMAPCRPQRRPPRLEAPELALRPLRERPIEALPDPCAD